IACAAIGPLALHGNPSSYFRYQNLGGAFLTPSAAHPLGTDHLGRDVLVRLLYGTRYTLLISFAAVLAGLVVGIPVGAASGYLGGWLDLVVQRIVDVFLAFPSFLLAL